MTWSRDDDGRRDPPGPLARADEAGLDAMLERLELAEREWGDGFAPPLLLRRLVNHGRLGRKTGQGFFFYPRPDEGVEQKETVLLETRDGVAILWLNRPPTNPISPQVVRDLTAPSGTRSSHATRSARWSSPRRTSPCSAPAPTSRSSRR